MLKVKFNDEYNPGFPFTYQFLDDDFQYFYTGEKTVSILLKYFAGLAILISCLGLFGLTTFTTERRAKEIGIRKILELNVFGILRLLLGAAKWYLYLKQRKRVQFQLNNLQ